MTKADRSIRLITDARYRAPWDNAASHPLQSWAWGEFRSAMGVDVVRLGVFEGSELVEGWQLSFHTILYTPFAIGYFPKGPAPTNEMIDKLTTIGRQKKAIFIQLEPNVISRLQPTTHNPQPLLPSHHPLFTKHTFVLDLTKSEDELLKAMSQKTRYNIKVAQKHGVEIKQDDSSQAFADYLRLSEETTRRQRFYAHNRLYHERMWQHMRRAGIAHVFTAAHQGKTLAAWIVFVWKDTVYYPYGASSRHLREVMAPNLLLWEIARWAKTKGFKYFDLWGALAPLPDGGVNTNDPWYGFHRFKEGYRPKLVELVGSFDLVINPFLYQCYKLTDRIRWFLLKRFHQP